MIPKMTQKTVKEVLFRLFLAVTLCFNFLELACVKYPVLRTNPVMYYPVLIALCMILLWAVFRFYKIPDRISWPGLVTACVLTFLLITGFCLDATASQRFFYSESALTRLVLFAGMAFFVYGILLTVFDALDAETSGTGKLFSDWKAFWLAFAVMLVCWVPIIAVNYPGGIAVDSAYQIKQVYGLYKPDGSHPLFVTVIYGALFWLGQCLGNDNFGFFLIVVFQTLLCGIAMARSCKWILKLTQSMKNYILLVAFFAIVPTWGAAVQCVLKDTVHVGAFLLFFVSYLKIIWWKDCRAKDYIGLSVFALITALSRKAAFPIILISLLLVILIFIKNKDKLRKVATAAAVMLAVYALINGVLYSSDNITPPREVENYSLPFQMVARYCVNYGHELTEEEIAVIDSVLDYEAISSQYTPDTSDPIKKTFHAAGEDMTTFWELFIRLGLKHPKVYAQHLIAGSYKYFYPLTVGVNTHRTYIAEDPSFYDVYHVNPQLKSVTANYFQKWETTVGLNLLIGPGLYVWMMLILLGYALHKRSGKALVTLAPVLVLIVGMLFTHVNGENRYAYPIIACAPLCWSVIRLTAYREKKQ